MIQTINIPLENSEKIDEFSNVTENPVSISKSGDKGGNLGVEHSNFYPSHFLKELQTEFYLIRNNEKKPWQYLEIEEVIV